MRDAGLGSHPSPRTPHSALSVVPPRIRRPAVAGYYYPANTAALTEALQALLPRDAAPTPARAVIIPHDSLRRSGAIAAAALSRVVIPRRCILLGPSHSGSWMRWSLMSSGAYRTPLGEIPVDAPLAEALRARCPFLEPDAWAQRGEHAIEAIVPFLQRLGPPGLTIVPIIVGSEDDGEVTSLAEALQEAVRASSEPVLLIASSDLSHFEPQARAAAQDRWLMQAICALDGDGLRRAVRDGAVRMCGEAAVACILQAAKGLGAGRGIVARHGTSAEAAGDPGSVTGYAGIIID